MGYYGEPRWRGVGTAVDETVGVGNEKAVGAVDQELGGESATSIFRNHSCVTTLNSISSIVGSFSLSSSLAAISCSGSVQ